MNDENEIGDIYYDIDLIIKKNFPYLKCVESLNAKRTKLAVTQQIENKGEFNEENLYKENLPLIVKLIPSTKNELEKNNQSLKNIQEKFKDINITPHILPILKIVSSEESGCLIVLRQFISSTLKDLVNSNPFLSLGEKLVLFSQVLMALQNLNKEGFNHGDIKPENILISDRFSLFLCDPAPYKPIYIEYNDIHKIQSTFVNTEIDDIESMHCYLAPERFRDSSLKELTPEMDIFSVGAIMLEFFLNKEIFTHNILYNKEEYYKIINENLSYLKSMDDETTNKVYETLSGIFMNMLKFEPKDRINSNKCLGILTTEVLPFTVKGFLLHLNKLFILNELCENDTFIAFCFKHFSQIYKIFSYYKNKEMPKEDTIPKLKNYPNVFVLDRLRKSKEIYDVEVGGEFKKYFPLIFLKPKGAKFFNRKISEELIHQKMKKGSQNEGAELVLIRNLLKSSMNVKYKSSIFSAIEMIEHLCSILVKKNIKNHRYIMELIVPYIMNLVKLEDQELSEEKEEDNSKEKKDINNESHLNFGMNSMLNIYAFRSVINLLSMINYDKLILGIYECSDDFYLIYKKLHNFYVKSRDIRVKIEIMKSLEKLIDLHEKFGIMFFNSYRNLNQKNNKLKNNLNEDSSNIKNQKLLHLSCDRVLKIYSQICEEFNEFLIDLFEKGKSYSSDILRIYLIKEIPKIMFFIVDNKCREKIYDIFVSFFSSENSEILKEIVKVFPMIILPFGNDKILKDFYSLSFKILDEYYDEFLIDSLLKSIKIVMKMAQIQNFTLFGKIASFLVHPNIIIRKSVLNIFEILFNMNDKNDTLKGKLYSFLNKNIKNAVFNNISRNNNKCINLVNKNIIKFINDNGFIRRYLLILYNNYIEYEKLNENKVENHEITSILNKIGKKNIYVENPSINRVSPITKKIADTIFPEMAIALRSPKYGKDDFLSASQYLLSQLVSLCEVELKEFKPKKNLKKILSKISKCENSFLSPESLLKIILLKIRMDNDKIEEINTNNLISSTNHNMNCYNYKNNDNGCSVDNLWRPSGKKICEFDLNHDEFVVGLFEVMIGIGENEQEDISSSKSQNIYFVSISNECNVNLYAIGNDVNFPEKKALKKLTDYQIDFQEGNVALSKNLISVINYPFKFIIIFGIKSKLFILTMNFMNSLDERNLKDISDAEKIYMETDEIDLEKREVVMTFSERKMAGKVVVVFKGNRIGIFDHKEKKDGVQEKMKISNEYGFIQNVTLSNNFEDLILCTNENYIIFLNMKLNIVYRIYQLEEKYKIFNIYPFYVKNFNQDILIRKKYSEKDYNFYYFIVTENNSTFLINFNDMNIDLFCETVFFTNSSQVKTYSSKTPKIEEIKGINDEKDKSTVNLEVTENYFLGKEIKDIERKNGGKIAGFLLPFRTLVYSEPLDYEVVEKINMSVIYNKNINSNDSKYRYSMPYFITILRNGTMYFWNYTKNSQNDITINDKTYLINNNNNNNSNFSFSTKKKTKLIICNEFEEEECENKSEATDVIYVNNESGEHYIVVGYIKGKIEIFK